MAENANPKLTLAFLNTKLVAQGVRMDSMQSEIDELKLRLTALGNTRGTRQNQNVGRPITDNQAKALFELKDLVKDPETQKIVVPEGFDFMTASRRLDEWTAAFRAFGVKSYRCSFCDAGQHSDREQARQCAKSGDKRSKNTVTNVPEVDDLNLPAYS